MALDIETLKKMQAIDREIYALGVEKEEIPDRQEDMDDQLIEVTEKYEEMDCLLTTKKLRLSEKELELKEEDARFKQLEVKLPQVKTNREYKAIQSEQRMLEAEKEKLESIVLEMMDDVKVDEDAMAVVSAEKEAKEKEVAEQKALLDQRLLGIDAEVARLEAECKGFESQVAAPVLSVYKRIVMARSGSALSQIVNQACSMCQMSLTAQKLNEVMMEDELIQCDECSRILYLEKEDA